MMKKLCAYLTVLLLLTALVLFPACDDKQAEPSKPNGENSEIDKGENNGTAGDSENGKTEGSTDSGNVEGDTSNKEDEKPNDPPAQPPPSDPSDPYENDKHWELP